MERQVREADQGECQLSIEVGKGIKWRTLFRPVCDVCCGGFSVRNDGCSIMAVRVD